MLMLRSTHENEVATIRAGHGIVVERKDAEIARQNDLIERLIRANRDMHEQLAERPVRGERGRFQNRVPA